MYDIGKFIEGHFGINQDLFPTVLKESPSAMGYIYGATSEVLLKQYLESKGFEVLRIVEKPSGGNNAKSSEARGDFYIRPKGSDKDEWLVIESKGLKSNSEFRGAKLDSRTKVFKFLKLLAFQKSSFKEDTYKKGYNTYLKAKEKWEKNNPGKNYPDFRWNKESPGAVNCNLNQIWKDEEDLKNWVESMPLELFQEKAYRSLQGPIIILETHQPSKRVAPITGNDQAAPLVKDFNIMAVDLFLRTRKHEFAFMNAEKISHSPTSPEHLYQNYTIDILVKGKKDKPVFSPPWYSDILDCINNTKPLPRKLDESQLDTRENQEEVA